MKAAALAVALCLLPVSAQAFDLRFRMDVNIRTPKQFATVCVLGLATSGNVPGMTPKEAVDWCDKAAELMFARLLEQQSESD